MKDLRVNCVAVVGVAAALALQADAQANGFIEDSKATLSMRNFYMNDDSRSGSPSVDEWGQGFLLNYKSGYTNGPVGFGVDAVGMLGLKLDSGGRAGKAGISRTPGNMFPRDSDGSSVDDYSSLGLTGKIRISKSELLLGTLMPRNPVIGYSDGRMLPQTFQGTQITSKEIDKLQLTAGLIERSKARGSSSSDPLSAPGATGKTNKFYYGGADYQLTKNLLLQYYYGEHTDFYKQHFLGAIHELPLGSGSLKTDMRYFHTDSTGANSRGDSDYLMTGYYGSGRTKGQADNDTWSGLFTYTIGGHSVGAGYQSIRGDSYFPSVNQGDGSYVYLITDSIIGRFGAAGEDTWQAKYGYDFTVLGMPGLTFNTIFNRGTGAKTASAPGKEQEYDTTLSYVVQSGTFKGLGFAYRNAVYRNDLVVNGTRNDQNRVIVSYTLPLL
jgi:hypothetical protein